MKVVAVIQARMGSTRLPGKVLMDLGGHPVIEWCARACELAPGVDDVWIATSTLPQDDVIAEWCNDVSFNCWRGSETDVLSRFVGCARASGADVVLRITGDEPFVDPQVIGTVVRLQRETGADYVSNVSPRTYPDGLDVQAMTIKALLAADAEATRQIDRDCVTTWIERNRSRFPAETVINPIPGMHTERWVLDTADDYAFCQDVARKWPFRDGPPTMLDILHILDEDPLLREINNYHPMNERYFDALAEEPIYARSYQRSQEQFEKAKQVIPLGAQTFSKSYLQYPQPSPLFVSHGDGALVFDTDGNEYVDLVSALLPNILGYRDPDVDAAIRRQLSSGISFSLATELEERLAGTLTRLIPCAEMVRFGKTGTDVTSAAIRAARAFTGRDRILICGGYHGWQDWSTERNLGVPEDVKKLSLRVRADAAEIGEAMSKERFAACIIEPECGAPLLRLLRELCFSTGTVLIFDEVITGFRFDLGGAQKLYGVTPDLATFGKAMANGMPLSAIAGRRDIMAKFAPPDNIFYSGTFFGEALSLAAGIATIAKLERDAVILKLWWNGGHLRCAVDDLISKHGLAGHISLTGKDVFIRVKFSDDKIAALFRKEMIASGTLIAASHNIGAAHGPSEIKRILKSYDHTLAIIADALDNGAVDEHLGGSSIAKGVRS